MDKITVFTATYNRSHTLPRLYNSLLNQKYSNFEWLIIDDGSTDDTEDVIKQFIKEDKIVIKYLKVKNGGKHRAINKALDIVDSCLFFIVDSDDYLVNDLLYKISVIVKDLDVNEYCGIVGLKGYSMEQMIGKTFKGKYLDITMLEREKNNILGDKAEIFFTEVIKKYRFSEYQNENFITEATLWNRMALDGYKMRYFNDIIYICEYLDDGLTKNITNTFSNNPQGLLEYIKQMNLINKTNIVKRIKYSSYYYEAVKNYMDIKTAAEKLGVRESFLFFSILLRTIIKGGKRQ